ncbi:MAG: hypothetical protein NVS3B16_10880 [Vulcanimicrobiaceae bacterium]
MNAAKPAPAPLRPADRVRSFLGYAFLISFLVHLVTVPFFHLKGRQQDKSEVEKVSVTKKIKVIVPTPPPPTPTPPPPTPPPKQTPPPVKQTNPPPQVKLKINPPKTTSKSTTAKAEKKYIPPPNGSQNGVPKGNVASAQPAPAAPAAPAATGVPATPAPTPPPTPTPTPKPVCAVPNADATTTRPVEPDYPDIARQQGAVGTANIKVSLDATGHVLDASIQKSAGNAALDQAALRAARASSFSPEIVNCVKTAGSYLFRADFTGQ